MIGQLFQLLDPLLEAIYTTAAREAPKVVAAVLLVLLSWALARTARWVTRRAARAEWLERLLHRSGIISGLVEPSLAEPRRIVAGVIYWCILIAGAASALAVVSEHAAAQLAAVILILLPKLLLAFAIITAAWWLSGYWARSVLIWLANEGMESPWWWAAAVRISVVAAGIALASETTGFATTLVRSSFLILLAGGTFAAAQALAPILRSHLEARRSQGHHKAQEEDDRLLR